VVAVVATDYSGNSATNWYQLLITNGGAATTLTYDLNGNLVSSASTNTTNTYQWDAAGRLITITQAPAAGPLETSRFAYDGLGRRTSDTEALGNLVSASTFVWDRYGLAEQRDITGTLPTKRFFGQGEQISGFSYYFARNYLGSVQEMTDSSGSIRADYTYDPYGVRSTNLKTGTTALDADFGFTGHYFHAPSQLHLALFRAYDAHNGRWLNRDPLEEAPGLNLYAYAGNNPISHVDPLGLCFGIWIGAGPAYENFTGNTANSVINAPVKNVISDPVSGLINYFFNGGQPAEIGEPLASALFRLQQVRPWPPTTTPCNLAGIRDYGSWSRPFSSALVQVTLGQFRYTESGGWTTISDTYAFPFKSYNWSTGGYDYHNALLSVLPGTPYNISGCWCTPSSLPGPEGPEG
jgi:RHS repeat-associated protein